MSASFPSFSSAGPEVAARNTDHIISLHRRSSRKSNPGTPLAGIEEKYRSAGAFINVLDQHLTYGDIKSQLACFAEKPNDAILLYADPSSGVFVYSSYGLLKNNLGGLLDLPAEERAMYFDATFKMMRTDAIFGAIGTNTVVDGRNTQMQDAVALALAFDGHGGLFEPPTTGQRNYRLSFRPLVYVIAPAESALCWVRALSCLALIAAAWFGVDISKGQHTLFAVACADHAASGQLAASAMFQQITWIHCWAHIMRNVRPRPTLHMSHDRAKCHIHHGNATFYLTMSHS